MLVLKPAIVVVMMEDYNTGNMHCNCILPETIVNTMFQPMLFFLIEHVTRIFLMQVTIFACASSHHWVIILSKIFF